MTLATKTYTFSNGATIYASEHNTNFDTLFSTINGELDNSNIKANAGIIDTKLSTISTANKVGGSSFSGLASITSGAGIIPVANGSLGKNFASTTSGRVLYFSETGTITDSAVGTVGQLLTSSGSHVYWSTVTSGDMFYSNPRFALGTFTISNSTGTQVVTGVGFSLKYIEFEKESGGDFYLSGCDNGIIHYCSQISTNGTATTYTGSVNSSIMANRITSGAYLLASVTSIQSDGFTLDITKIGSGYTGFIRYKAYR